MVFISVIHYGPVATPLLVKPIQPRSFGTFNVITGSRDTNVTLRDIMRSREHVPRSYKQCFPLCGYNAACINEKEHLSVLLEELSSLLLRVKKIRRPT